MLGDFPIKVVNIIMEKVDPIERLTIRKVSRKLRILIDQISDLFETIRIDIENTLTTIYLNNRNIFYKENGIVEFDGKRKVIEGELHTGMALNDLKIILQNPNLNLQDFTITLYVNGDNSKIRETYLKIIQKFWSTLICIKSQRSLIGGFTFGELVYFLPKFKAQKLEDLRLDMCQKINDERYINELVQLEQWKRAKSVEFTRNYLLEIPIRNLIHFSRCELTLKSILTKEDVLLIKQALHNNPATIESLYFGTPISDPTENLKIFEPLHAGGEGSINYEIGDFQFEIHFYSDFLHIKKKYKNIYEFQ